MSLLSLKQRFQLPVWDDPAQSRYTRVAVNLDLCNGCKFCALVCPANVIEIIDGKARVKENNRGCISCNNCHAICSHRAIQAENAFDFSGYYQQFGLGPFSFPRKF